MRIIETIIKQQGADSTTVQAMRQFFPIIEQAEAELRAERGRLQVALEHCLSWLPEDCSAACEARAALNQQEAEK